MLKLIIYSSFGVNIKPNWHKHAAKQRPVIKVHNVITKSWMSKKQLRPFGRLTESLRSSAPNWFLAASAGVALSSTGAAYSAIYLLPIVSDADTIRLASPSHYELNKTSRTLHVDSVDMRLDIWSVIKSKHQNGNVLISTSWKRVGRPRLRGVCKSSGVPDIQWNMASC